MLSGWISKNGRNIAVIKVSRGASKLLANELVKWFRATYFRYREEVYGCELLKTKNYDGKEMCWFGYI